MARMDAGRCRQCGRPFTSGEVTGVGILRPRPAHAGGPFVEFACPGCKTVLRLVPYGHGRYGLPGAPPPPPPTDDERQVPWRRGAAPPGPSSERPDADPRARRRGPAPQPTPAPEEPGRPAPDAAGPAPSASAATADAARDVAPPADALEALRVLGLRETASAREVEDAFRALALQCHPDKVAHLDADFVALAERKFRRLQAARDLLLGT